MLLLTALKCVKKDSQLLFLGLFYFGFIKYYQESTHSFTLFQPFWACLLFNYFPNLYAVTEMNTKTVCGPAK